MKSVAPGWYHALAVLTDGTVQACGRNNWGQLADEDLADRYRPAPIIGISNVVSIDTSYGHSLALLEDGSLWSWGENDFGQVGNGTVSPRETKPVRVSGL